ncbi:hypothetical protein ACCAA_1070024 [Candidatus Accumulibacter aalborgensis]|uniref:Uncharacterized protein n=1 Tax=Candidatus Accumulibacter aalborgensis TaxID=1860102 RepID=A0A1A8XEJ3_9PROT|nr:hypothetical protein [Candidatus Accumulibacter aalborgensis]SBT03595.1 hypothetical protein ACCAA_1070024 [Candidatus Accumulibacter aalborgensis]
MNGYKLSALTQDMDALREYVLKDCLLLYALLGGTIYSSPSGISGSFPSTLKGTGDDRPKTWYHLEEVFKKKATRGIRESD